MKIRSLNHSVYQHMYHIVWGTKYRRKWLKPYVKEAFLESLFQIAREYPSLRIEHVSTDEDHVHLQVEISPAVSVASAVQVMKGRTSLFLKKKFKFVREIYLDEWIWSDGYFSSTIGINEKIIARYIEQQWKKDIPQDADQQGFEFS